MGHTGTELGTALTYFVQCAAIGCILLSGLHSKWGYLEGEGGLPLHA